MAKLIVMKNLIKRLVVCVMVVMFSCGSGVEIGEYKISTLDSVEKNQATLIELDGKNFGPIDKYGQPIDILLMGSRTIIQDKKKDYAFSVLDEEGQLVQLQPIGEGPDMIEQPGLAKIVGFDDVTNKMYIFDYVRKTLNSLKISKGATLQETSRIPNIYWGELQSAISINDSLIAVTGRFSDTKFIVFNRYSGKELLRSENVNAFTTKLSVEGRTLAAPRDVVYNKKNNLLVLSNANLNSIDTYTPNGKSHKFYSFGELKNLSEENGLQRDFFYYYDVKTVGDVVYGLFLGKKHSDIAMQEIFLSSARPELHIFNLKTDAMTRYKMDRVVNACVLDLDNNLVYCIDENNENQPLVKYEIP
jgi:hypothetical protein